MCFEKNIKIENKYIGKESPCFIIAEAGVNHNGDISLAKKLIDIAKESGADAVKFQTWKTEELLTKQAKQADYQKENTGTEESQSDMVKRLELTYDNFKELKKYADKKGIIFLSTPDEEKSAHFLYELGVSAFKIGSGELTNIPYLERVAQYKKPIILSTGMGTLEEVRGAVDCIKKYNNKLILLHCTSDYPTDIKDVNLNAMLTLQKEFDLIVGYSDHTLSLDTPKIAVLLGAKVIEKHFTLDKNLPGPDHKASFEPKELKNMVQEIRKIEKMNLEQMESIIHSIRKADTIRGSYRKKPTQKEIETRKIVRKTIVAKYDIEKNEEITEKNIAFKRFGQVFIEPKDYKNIIGKGAKIPIKKDEVITYEKLSKKRKIIYFTDTRAEYGLMKPTLKAISNHPKLDLYLVVAGMHLSEKYGLTVNNIKEDNLFRIISEVETLSNGDTGKDMAISIANSIIKFSKILDENKPDIILLEGDRGCQLAAAIAAAHMNIPIAHISGGDISKSIDDSIRNAITKFSHIHFPGTKKSARNIIKMGEEPWRVFMVGTPINLELKSPTFILKEFNLDINKPILLVVQHPITTQVNEAGKQMKETLDAICDLKYQTILIYPNTDAGNRKIIKVIEDYEHYKFIRTFKSISNELYMGLLNISSVIIGNSSSGIVESPFFKLPAVNIGIRQQNRERGDNIIDVSHNKDKIKKAIEKALTPGFRENIKYNPYSEKKPEKEIPEILAKIEINNKLLEKDQYFKG